MIRFWQHEFRGSKGRARDAVEIVSGNAHFKSTKGSLLTDLPYLI